MAGSPGGPSFRPDVRWNVLEGHVEERVREYEARDASSSAACIPSELRSPVGSH